MLPRKQCMQTLIRQHVESGLLPCLVPKRILAGYGSSSICIACDDRITTAQVEYEIHADTDGRRLSFHFGCYVLWQLECAAAQRVSRI